MFNKYLQDANNGDFAGLADIYSEYYSMMLACAFKVNKNYHDAEDAIDQVFTRLMLQPINCRSFVTDPNSYMAKAAMYAAIDAVRAQKISVDLETTEYTIYDSETEKAFSNVEFFDLIKDLDDIEQDIIVDRFVNNKRFGEIADEKGMPRSSVSSLFYRAIQKLRRKNPELIKDHGRKPKN